jgi:Ca2+-binding EF-hand superfamily protein
MNVCTKYHPNFRTDTNKFGQYGRAFYYESQRVFRRLPLATIIENSGDNRYFIVHGGISDKTRISFIYDGIQRGKFASIDLGKTNTETSLREDQAKALCDVLWSDPTSNNGCIDNNKRGIGTLFGEDVCERFCFKYDFKSIFRSHEARADGFTNDNKYCATVFSVSKYCGGTNKASVIQLSGTENEYKIHKFETEHFSPGDYVVEKKFLLKSFRSILNRESNELMRLFKEEDSDGNGYIGANVWARLISNHLKSIYGFTINPKHLVTLKDYLCPSDGDQVLFSKMFNRKGNSHQNEQLLLLLNQIFAYIDLDGNGLLSMDELTHAVKLINEKTGNNYDEKIFSKFDTNNDGLISMKEVKQAFIDKTD